MHTHIPNLMETPFRGITTIQLFDKEGNLIEETQHENTYNQRLRYLSYIDTILKCRMPNISNDFALTISNADTLSTALNHMPSINPFGSGTSTYVMQPYAFLWLTNNTSNEDINGYPNGTPVSYSTTAGVPGGAVSNLAAGYVNMSESYLNNDRLHLVFDFDTARGNVTFDSLWLYPGTTRFGSGGAMTYSTLPFFHFATIYTEPHPTFEIPMGHTRAYIRALNNFYTMLVLSDTTTSRDIEETSFIYAKRVIIFNEETGSIISDCTFASTMNLLNIFYFDEGTNSLYQMYTATQPSYAIFEESTSTEAPFYKINLTTGTRELVDYTRNLFGMKKSDYNYVDSTSGTWSYNTLIYHLTGENTTMVMIPTEGPDADTGLTVPYVSWFMFDPLLEKFTLVKRLRIYSSATNSTNTSPQLYTYESFVLNGLLYLNAMVSPDLDVYNRLAVFNIKTGELIDDKRMSANPISKSIPYRYALNVVSSRGSSSFDLKRFRKPKLVVTSSDVTYAKLEIAQTSGAFWTTHNKLSSPVTKTDQTTMKIQYDIIWDNIKDTIVPGLV